MSKGNRERKPNGDRFGGPPPPPPPVWTSPE